MRTKRYYDLDLAPLADLLQYHGDEISRSDNLHLLRCLEELQDLRTYVDRAWRVTDRAMTVSRS